MSSNNYMQIYAMEIEAGRHMAKRYDDAYETLFYEITRKMIAEIATQDNRKINMVLDIGCGTGNLTKFFSGKQNCHVVAVDISIEMLRVAKNKLEEFEFLSATADDIPFKDCSFDVIMGYSSLHHLPDLGRFFSEVFRILRPGGLFIFAEPIESFLGAHKTLYRFFKLPLYLAYLFFKLKNSRQLKVFQDINFDGFSTPAHRQLSEKEIIDAISKSNSRNVPFRIKRLGILSPWFGAVLFKSNAMDRLIFKPVWYLDLILSRVLVRSTSEVFISGKVEKGTVSK